MKAWKGYKKQLIETITVSHGGSDYKIQRITTDRRVEYKWRNINRFHTAFEPVPEKHHAEIDRIIKTQSP